MRRSRLPEKRRRITDEEVARGCLRSTMIAAKAEEPEAANEATMHHRR